MDKDLVEIFKNTIKANVVENKASELLALTVISSLVVVETEHTMTFKVIHNIIQYLIATKVITLITLASIVSLIASQILLYVSKCLNGILTVIATIITHIIIRMVILYWTLYAAKYNGFRSGLMTFTKYTMSEVEYTPRSIFILASIFDAIDKPRMVITALSKTLLFKHVIYFSEESSRIEKYGYDF